MNGTPYRTYCTKCADQSSFSCIKVSTYNNINYLHRRYSNHGCSNDILHCNHDGWMFATRSKLNKEWLRILKRHINDHHQLSSLYLPVASGHNANELEDNSNIDNIFMENNDVTSLAEVADNMINNTDTSPLKENDVNAIQKLATANFKTPENQKYFQQKHLLKSEHGIKHGGIRGIV